MPWNTKSQQQMKKEFIRLVTQKEVSMREACRLYEISRKTGYKWLRRYEEQGEKGLEEISRKPHNQATKLNEDIICRMLEPIRAAVRQLRPVEIDFGAMERRIIDKRRDLK